MAKNMSKQVQIYSVGGNYFYNKEENEVYKQILEQSNIMSALERFNLYSNSILTDKEKKKHKFNSYEDIKNIYEMRWSKDFGKEEKKVYNSKKHIKKYFTDLEKKYYSEVETIKKELKAENETYRECLKVKTDKEKQLEQLLRANTDVRQLNTEKLAKYDVISLFDSNLTRVMNLEFNKLSKDLLIVEITQHIIMDYIIDKGFDWKNENGENDHYIFLVSSAGQVRKQKLVMIKEKVHTKIIDILTCGLTLEIINSKENGGFNVNKYLAYLSLNDSATEVWEGFNIDECIVIPDFETEVVGDVDYIGTTDALKSFDKLDEKGNKVFGADGKSEKEIRTVKALLPSEPRTMPIKISHSDGAGWILPSLSKVSFMCRLPWIKGLLVPTNYILWCELFNEGNYKITDIDGREWDLKEDNIKIIFTESQFKMHKFYKNIVDKNDEKKVIKYGWDIYKDNFKGKDGWDINCDEIVRVPCIANKCNEEPKNAKQYKQGRLNYQMLQTLVNMTEIELEEFTNPIKTKVANAYIDRETQLEMLGAVKTNKRLTNFQKALMLYPALLKDSHVKDELSTKISSLKNDAREGKFSIDAKNTFIIPDIFAWMEYSLGENKVNPQGLLKDGQVYCNLYKEEKQLLVDRSPHLYAEHAVRENYTGYAEYKGKQILISDWFTTNGVYTSYHDVISKLLQFDNDGDKSLVIKGSLVEIADREMKAMNIKPIYYEMSKADAEQINNNSIIKSLKSAFHFGNIGKYSNKLTKIWNGKEKDLETARLLTALNNFYIDGAKTNYCPEIFSSVKSEVKTFKINQKIKVNEQIEKLKETQRKNKKEILDLIEDKEDKKIKREELNKQYGLEISELKAKLNIEVAETVFKEKSDLTEKDMHDKIKVADKDKLPYFFKYAKDMKTNKVEEMNDSTVNKACKLIDEIPQGKYYFGKENRNWHYLANNFNTNLKSEKALAIIEQYELLNNRIRKYFTTAKEKEDDSNKDGVKVAIAARVYSTIRKDFEDFIKDLEVNISDATDIVVRYIYKNKPGCKKAFLFDILGDVILQNIKNNIEAKTPKKNAKKGHLYCVCCGKEVKKESNRQKFCEECADNERKEKDRLRKSKKKIA